MEPINVKVIGTGSYVPEKVLTNEDLEEIVDTSDEWITTRTGIKTRRIAAEDEATSDMAYKAALKALDDAGLVPKDIDLIIVATITPDMFFPSTACWVQEKLKAENATAFDLSAACSGYIFSYAVASGFLSSGMYKNALVIGAEKLTSIVDWEDRGTCVLFGDGAGAAVLTTSSGDSQLLAYDLGSNGAYGDLLYIPGGGSRNPATEESVKKRMHYIKMNGNAVFKIAVNKMKETVINSMKKANIKPNDISLLIPHQANLRIIDALRRALKLTEERVFVNINKYGNTSAASIAIAFDEAIKDGRIKRGDIVGFAAFGGGLTWGSAILKY